MTNPFWEGSGLGVCRNLDLIELRRLNDQIINREDFRNNREV